MPSCTSDALCHNRCGIPQVYTHPSCSFFLCRWVGVGGGSTVLTPSCITKPTRGPSDSLDGESPSDEELTEQVHKAVPVCRRAVAGAASCGSWNRRRQRDPVMSARHPTIQALRIRQNTEIARPHGGHFHPCRRRGIPRNQGLDSAPSRAS